MPITANSSRRLMNSNGYHEAQSDSGQVEFDMSTLISFKDIVL